MKNPLRNITFVFVVIACLPVGYLVYELGSYNRNEKIINQIYQDQLETILFAVNQYSDDIVGSWANKINIALMRKTGSTPAEFIGVHDVNSLYACYVSDLTGRSDVFRMGEGRIKPEDTRRAGKLFEENEGVTINKLISYFEAGFRKTEPLDTVLDQRYLPIMFVLDAEIRDYRLAILFLDIELFFQSSLGPKMQSVAGDKFVISARKSGSGEVVYSTSRDFLQQHNNPLASSQNKSGEAFRKPLWLMPGYELEISMVDASISELVSDRMKTSVALLVLLLSIFVFGFVFLFRNIKSQMRLSQAKTEFVSNVSHEIRTPLSLISMYAETLEMGRVPEEKKQEYYSIISNETNRLAGIVNRILDFSKVEAKKKEFAFRLVDLNEICKEVLNKYVANFDANGFKIDVDLAPEIKLVEGDRESIEEAVINLLDNAMKYSKKVKHLTVQTKVLGDYAIIEVRDCGIGIPRAYQKDIFEQFYRAPMGNVHDTKGSGLGLALVKKTMEAHKGKVEVESELDRGSTFRLHFPVLMHNRI